MVKYDRYRHSIYFIAQIDLKYKPKYIQVQKQKTLREYGFIALAAQAGRKYVKIGRNLQPNISMIEE